MNGITTREGSRRQLAADALIKAGMRMFANAGVDTVPLRDVARAAGHRNVNAVQYHFGDREGLILAIYKCNILWLEKRRAELLAHLTEEGTLQSLPDLVRAFFQPLLELVNEEGMHVYAAFHNQILNSPVRDAPWVILSDITPVMNMMNGLITSLAPCKDKDIMRQRFVFATIVVLNMLGRWDEHVQKSDTPYPPILIEDALSTAVNIMSAP